MNICRFWKTANYTQQFTSLHYLIIIVIILFLGLHTLNMICTLTVCCYCRFNHYSGWFLFVATKICILFKVLTWLTLLLNSKNVHQLVGWPHTVATIWNWSQFTFALKVKRSWHWAWDAVQRTRYPPKRYLA